MQNKTYNIDLRFISQAFKFLYTFWGPGASSIRSGSIVRSVKTNKQTNYSCPVITAILTLLLDQSQSFLTGSDQSGAATGNCHSATPLPCLCGANRCNFNLQTIIKCKIIFILDDQVFIDVDFNQGKMDDDTIHGIWMNKSSLKAIFYKCQALKPFDAASQDVCAKD